MTYKVIVTREGGNWLADVPDVSGAHTFARTLPALRRSVAEAVVLMDDLDDGDEVDLHFTYDVDDPAVVHAAELGEDRKALAAREKEIKAATEKSVRALVGRGYSVREIAALLGITGGRVSQIANA